MSYTIDVLIYKLGTENSFLEDKYTRSQLVPFNDILLKLKTFLKTS